MLAHPPVSEVTTRLGHNVLQSDKVSEGLAVKIAYLDPKALNDMSLRVRFKLVDKVPHKEREPEFMFVPVPFHTIDEAARFTLVDQWKKPIRDLHIVSTSGDINIAMASPQAVKRLKNDNRVLSIDSI